MTGRFQSEEEIENYPVNIDGQGNRTLLPGDLIYEDVNNDGIINQMDERPIGYSDDSTPFLNFGLNAQVNYKSLQVIVGLFGGSLQSWNQAETVRVPFYDNGNSPEYLFEDRWHRQDPYNDQSNWISGQYPAIREGNLEHSNYRHNDFWLKNVNYLRLRNLAVTYSLPNQFVQRFGLEGINITGRASNLFSIDNMRDVQVDPEIDDPDGLQYPQQRLFSFSFEIQL
ncbi:MAG: hypothetical protein U5K69_08405 [Balneolaceae bacterium]|nr:hypothetical protein [Balneolaceae bacterium]